MPPNRVATTYRPNSTDATLARIMANQENSERISATHRAEIKTEMSIFHSDLNAKMAAIKEVVDRAATKADLAALDDRVGSLERDKWMKTGRSAAILFLIGLFSWLLPWLFVKK